VSIAKFSLTDCHGAEHQYEVIRFTVDEQAAFQLKLGAPLMEGVAAAISTLVPIFQDEEVRSEIMSGLPDGKGQASISFETIAKALSSANWQNAADVLVPLPKMILEQGGPQFIAEIFAKTERLTPLDELKGRPTVTEDPIDPNFRLRLWKVDERNAAFGDGNMGEYWKAAAMVLVANFSPTGPDGSVSWKGAVSSLTGGIVTL
jgi:hypothetical protein